VIYSRPESDLEEVQENQTLRDPFFNPFRVPKGINAKGIIADVLNQVQNFESHRRPRRRRRRPNDQANFEAAITAIVCDLIHRHLVAPGEDLAISLSREQLGRGSRYDGPASTSTLPRLLDLLAAPEMAFLEKRNGEKGNPFRRGRRTTIRAGERLLTRIEKYDVQLDDLGQDLDQETIILKRTKADYWDPGDRVDYDDTEETMRFRKQMRTINTCLAEAEIECDPYVAEDGALVDAGDRLLRRYFNNESFTQGGRLFGGFWQPLKSEERHRGITISGASVATLDYGQMFVRIMYGLAGAEPPSGDAYAIPGYSKYRKGIKKVFAALTFVEGDLKQRPKGTKKLLPRHGTVQDVTADIRAHHRPIAHLLEQLVGHQVSYYESQIMVDLLLRLRDDGVVALPIHDAVVVASSAVEKAERAMRSVFRERLGIEAVVTIELGEPAPMAA
jgi:hypothetical protein